MPDLEKKILIVDDEEPLRKVMRLMLRPFLGTVVYECSDGQAALDLIDDGLRPDLCFCDINMPRLDGFEFVKRIRRDPYLQSLPIVITSANRDKEVIAAIAKLQISGYLLKPYEPTKVRDLLKKFLQETTSSVPIPLSVSRNLLSKTVHVVEPDEEHRNRICEFIRLNEDWELHATATAEQLIARLNSTARPDLVIFGVTVPDEVLITSIKNLRGIPGLASLPVIVSPVSVDRQAVLALAEVKITALLLKPVHSGDIQAALLKVT